MITQEIKLKIHEEAELFSAFDPDQTLLSEEVAAYLERNCLDKYRSDNEDYLFHIYSDTPVNEDSVKTKLKNYFSREKDNISYSVKRLTLKQICLAVIGVLVLAFWYFLSVHSKSAGVVKLEIISIIGWVSIWEAASISIMQRPELVRMKKAYDRIANARIIIDVDSGQTGRQSGR